MATLNLPTVELVSTLRKVALAGAPSSQDWNDSFTETLSDLSTIVGTINNEILPIINALTAAALLPAQAPVGLEGRTVVSDSSDQTQLFYNNQTGSPLVVADSMRLLYGMLTTFSNQLTDLGVQVASLQQRLSSSNQNDLSLALQNITNTLNTTIANLNSYTTQLQGYETRLQRFKSKRVALPSIPAQGIETVSVLWTAAYPDNAYTVSVSLEAGTQDLQIQTFSLRANGTGVDVLIANLGSVAHSSGNLHAVAHYDPEVA
jgi:hypothetical protein